MSDQTLEYFTVISDKPHTLDDNVNAKLAQGWQLQGGVSVSGVITPFGTEKSPDIWWMYAQAMVRPKKEKT
jgi:hypothetical protein